MSKLQDIATAIEDAVWFLNTNDPAEIDNVRRALVEAHELTLQLIEAQRHSLPRKAVR